jgi:ABC-2 type transport system permease protein
MNALGNIVMKELKELVRDPKLMISMLAVPLLMFPLMGMAFSSAHDAAVTEMKTATTAFVSFDGTDGNDTFAKALKTYLEYQNITCKDIDAASSPDAVVKAVNAGTKALIVVPANFTEDLIAMRPASVELYGILRTYSISEPIVYQQLVAAVSTFSTSVVASRLAAAYPNESIMGLTIPIVPRSYSVIKGDVKEASPDMVINTVMGSSIMMPMMLMILIIMAGQLAATSVGMEKEQKTLEVLLTLPVKRIHILAGKLSGVIMVSLLATISYVVGFSFYFASLGVGSGGTVSLSEVGLAPQPEGLVLLMVALLLALVSALALSILLGVFTKDVRSAQSLLGVLYIPVMIPSLVLMFAPIASLPLAAQIAIYAIPFSYPVIAAQALYTQDYLVVGLGIIYELVFTMGVLAIAARVFSTEKILTARIDLRKKKGPPQD